MRMIIYNLTDGINLHQGISNTLVEQSMIRNTGDDIMAMWAQSPGTYQNNVCGIILSSTINFLL